MRFPILTVAAVLCGLPLAAQVQPCGANDLDRLLAGHPDPQGERQRIAQADAELEAFTAAWIAEHAGAERVSYTIPVVFHIIHNNGPENISDAQVEDAVRILNQDFNRLNPDWANVRPEFLPLVADVGIGFKLAKRDPQGNCTNGITRTQSPLTHDGTQAMKNLIQWPRNKYLNIWVAASADGAAGYTYRPGAVSNQPALDGIVILHDYTGAIGTGSVSRSRALTHEVGHWINLAHTWGNSNTPALESNCGDDDGVSDTPNTIGWTYCALSGTSCGSLDNVENYMEYSYCCKMFTEGQKMRMLAALNSSTAQRNQLHTASNLSATGVNEAPVLCQAAFGSDQRMVCAGTPITFTDLSYHGVVSRQWSFPGGSPATAEEAQVAVTYAEPGTYPVSLTVSDGSNSLASTLESYITVLAAPGAAPPVQEGFEALQGLNGPEWYALNPDGDNAFAVTGAAAYSGSRSLRLLNTDGMAGRIDELVSGTYDMTGAEAVSVSFRWAYARRTAMSNDELRFYISNDCGRTWLLRKVMRGSTNLPTAPQTPAGFVPSGPDQWAQAVVTNIGASSHVGSFRFKFTFQSDGGNNLYLDDININGIAVGMHERPAALPGMQAVPNPAKDQVQVRLVLDRPARLLLELRDALGREVRSWNLGERAPGEIAEPIGLEGLGPGAYVLRAQADGAAGQARLIIE